MIDLKLYKKTPAKQTFKIVKNLLTYGGKELSNEEKFRIKTEAMVFKTTLLYKILATHTADQMIEQLVENAKPRDPDTINYLRAIIADRRILIQEVDAWADAKLENPYLQEARVDRPQYPGVQS